MMVKELHDPIKLHIERTYVISNLYNEGLIKKKLFVILDIHYGSLVHPQAVLVTSTFKLRIGYLSNYLYYIL